MLKGKEKQLSVVKHKLVDILESVNNMAELDELEIKTTAIKLIIDIEILKLEVELLKL